MIGMDPGRRQTRCPMVTLPTRFTNRRAFTPSTRFYDDETVRHAPDPQHPLGPRIPVEFPRDPGAPSGGGRHPPRHDGERPPLRLLPPRFASLLPRRLPRVPSGTALPREETGERGTDPRRSLVHATRLLPCQRGVAGPQPSHGSPHRRRTRRCHEVRLQHF